MTVNPILIDAFSKAGPSLVVRTLAEQIKSGNFPPKGMPTELFPKYTLFGMDVSEEDVRAAKLLAYSL